jgi:hypothetical protein
MQALDGHALQTPFAQRADPRSLRDAEPRAGAEIERTERIACTVGTAEVTTRDLGFGAVQLKLDLEPSSLKLAHQADLRPNFDLILSTPCLTLTLT